MGLDQIVELKEQEDDLFSLSIDIVGHQKYEIEFDYQGTIAKDKLRDAGVYRADD